VLSQALKTAADLGLADLLAEGERTVDELAKASGVNADALYRVLRLLESEGVFRETVPRRFAQTELSDTLRSARTGGPRDYIRMINSEAYQAFAELSHSVKTGQTAFERMFGEHRFDWLDARPEKAALFQRAMMSLSQGAEEAAAKAFDFTRFRCVADIGGGHGALLSAVLARNSHLSGILFDRTTTIDAAKTGLGGPLPRTRFIAGDFFEAAPRGADVYMLKRILHDWDDERAARILQNCRNVLPDEGRTLVVERITTAGDAPDLNKQLDIVMLAITGGVERTEEEYARLFRRGGLKLERAIPSEAGIHVLEASPT